MHEYKVNILRVVDGDTVDVDIDLGFGMWLRKERVRVMGIDTPESRTSDKMEKVFGLAAKNRLTSLLGAEAILHTQVSKKGEDMKGKFGRVLGNFVSLNGEKCAAVLIREGHAVAYQGGSKENVASKHLANRERLVREGAVVIPEELKTASIAPVKKIIEPVVESVGKSINEPVPATRKPAAKKKTKVYSKHFETQIECTEFLDSWTSIIESRGIDTLQDMLKEGYSVKLNNVSCALQHIKAPEETQEEEEPEGGTN